MNSGGTNSLGENGEGWQQAGSCDFQQDLQQPSINTGGAAVPISSVPFFLQQLSQQQVPSIPLSLQQQLGRSTGFGMSGLSDGGASSMLMMGGGAGGGGGGGRAAVQGQVSEATVAAVAAAASAAAAAAAAAVVAAAGQQVQAFLQVHPPPGFPFFGMSPELLAQLSFHNQLQMSDSKLVVRYTCTWNTIIIPPLVLPHCFVPYDWCRLGGMVGGTLTPRTANKHPASR